MAAAAAANVAPYELMNASLLAQQPISLPFRFEHADENWNSIYDYLEKRYASLRSWRWSWWAYWSELAKYFIPRRYKWLVTANLMNRGSPLNDQIVDSTGTLALRTMAAGLWTGLTSPSRPWFKLGVGLPWVKLDADGKEWLEDTEQRVYTVLAQSNFYTTLAQAFQDVACFGTAPVLIYEDSEDVIRCYLPCAGEYYLAAGGRLSIDTLFREFTLTVEQIVDMFTLENCPQEVRTLWETSSLDQEFVIGHAIEPNFELPARGLSRPAVTVVPGGYPYREVYWLRGRNTNKALSIKGFHERPFMVARWSTVSNDPYGRSPAMDCLGDVKQIQQETRRKAEFIEKGVRPPMGADPALKNEPASIIPGHITYVSTANAQKGFWPLFEPHPQWLAGLTEDIKEVQQRIKDAMFVNLFMAISQMEGVQPRNELELTKRDLERLQELGPFVEMFENEFAGPAIRRVLGILERRRMLRPMPPSLRGVPLKIIYLSIMKLAQKSSESVAMKDAFATLGALSAAAKAAGVPDPIRVVDLDKSFRHYADLNNYPPDCLYTEEEVKEHDEIRAKAQQDSMMPGQAAAAVDAAKTLSETKLPDGNSALGAMLGQRPGGV